MYFMCLAPMLGFAISSRTKMMSGSMSDCSPLGALAFAAAVGFGDGQEDPEEQYHAEQQRGDVLGNGKIERRDIGCFAFLIHRNKTPLGIGGGAGDVNAVVVADKTFAVVIHYVLAIVIVMKSRGHEKCSPCSDFKITGSGTETAECP